MPTQNPERYATIRRIVVLLFTAYFTIMFVKNGYLKFDPEGFWGPAFEQWGYPVWFMFFVGFLEFAGGLAILIPRAAGYGALVLAAVMLGAFVTRLIHGMSLDDAISIAFNMIAMILLAYEYAPLKSMIQEERLRYSILE